MDDSVKKLTTEKINEQIIKSVLHDGVRTVLLSLIAAIASAFLLYKSVPDTYLLFWVSVAIIVSVLRMILIPHLIRMVGKKCIFVERAYLSALFLSGCTWAAEILLVEPGNEFALFVVLGSLIGVISGAAFTNLSYPRGYWFFMSPIGVFVLFQLMSFDFGNVEKLAVLFVLYIIGLSYIVARFKVRFHNVVGLSIENEELVEQLETSNENLVKTELTQSAIIDSIPDSLFMMNSAGEIVYQNRNVEEIFGYKPEELVNQKIEVLIPEKYHHEHVAIRNDFYHDNKPRFIGTKESKPVTARHKSGREFPVEIGLSYVVYQGERCVLAIVRDISEREYILQLEAEIANREAVEKEKKQVSQTYHDLVNALGEITYEHYVPEEKIVWTGAYEKVLGYNKEEMGDDDPSWLTRVHPDDLDDVYAEFSRAQQSDKIFSIEYRFRTKSGEYLWFYDRGIMTLDENGTLLTNVGVMKDISERKLTESKMKDHQRDLQAALNAAHAGLFTTKLETGEMVWDKRSCEIFGLDNAGYKGSFNDWVERVHPEDISDTLSAFQASLDSDENFELFYRIVTLKGEERYIHSMGTIDRNEKNEVVSAKGVNIDITEQHTANVEKELLHKQLQQAQKMESIGQLTGGIAHDFNNILLSVIGFSDLALRRALKNKDEKLIEYLRQVNQSGSRAKDLVKQMMVFSRVGDGDLKSVHVADIIDEVTGMLRPMLPSSMELETNIGENIPELLVDRVQIHQVLTNLCINARDAMKGEGLLKIEVATKMVDGHVCSACHHMFTGQYIAINVIDSGTGISKAIAEKIFEPFVTSKGVGEGTGMGLSMVHGIVHNHSGHITVSSQEGVGTEFSILLPIVTNAETDSDDMDAEAIIDDEFSELSGKRILVVDDEESLTTMFKALLEAKGCDVTTFNNSEAALAQFSETPDAFDVLITDQTMPNLTGSEMSKQVLAIRSDLPIIMLTGFSDTVNESQAREMGIRDFMYKPVNTGTILTAVQKLLSE